MAVQVILDAGLAEASKGFLACIHGFAYRVPVIRVVHVLIVVRAAKPIAARKTQHIARPKNVALRGPRLARQTGPDYE